MPTEVNVPDVGIISFPDSMTKSDIDAALRREFGPGQSPDPKPLPAPQPLTGNSNDQDAMIGSIQSRAVPVGTVPGPSPLDILLNEHVRKRDGEFGSLRSAPEPSIIARASDKVGEFLSPIFGPTETMQLQAGPEGYKPFGSKIDRMGLLPALFTPNEDSLGYLPPIGQQEGQVAQVAAALYNQGSGIVNSVLTPGGIAALLATGGLSSVVKAGGPSAAKAATALRFGAGAFAVDMGRHLPGQINHALETLQDPRATTQQTLEAFLSPAINALFVKHLGTEATAKLTQKIRNGVDVRREIVDVLEATKSPVNLKEIDAQARASLNPQGRADLIEGGQFQPMGPNFVSRLNLLDETRAALDARRNEAATSGLTDVGRNQLEPSLRSPFDDFIMNERVGNPVARPSGQALIVPDRPSAVRSDVEGGRVSWRRGAEETASIVTEDTRLALAQGNPPVETPVARPSGQALIVPDRGPLGQLELWADQVMKEGPGTTFSSLDPKLAFAGLVKGAIVFGRGVRDFTKWSSEMVNEFGESIRSHLQAMFDKVKERTSNAFHSKLTDSIESMPQETMTVGQSRAYIEKGATKNEINEGQAWSVLEDAFRKAKIERYNLPPLRREESVNTGETKMHKSVERALESDQIPDAAKDLLRASPDSYYDVQRVKSKAGENSVEDLAASMTDSQLHGADPRSNIYVASKKELALRMMARGDIDSGAALLHQLANEGLNMGQNIYQFSLLKGVDPTVVSRIVDRQLTDKGYDPLTKAQKKIIDRKSSESINQNNKAETAKNQWFDDPTDANAAAADAAAAKAKGSAIELQREILNHQPKTLPQILKAVIQGNLLTPLSESANIVGNVALSPFNFIAEAGAAGINALDSFISKRPRSVEFRPIQQTAAALRGMVEGSKTIPDIIRKGQGESNVGEQFRGLHPLRALKNLFTANPDVPTVGGKVKLSDRMGMAVEATFGAPAEVMLRGLAAGDAPFRGKAHAQAVARQLSLAKVPDHLLKMAQKYPELFLDATAMEKVATESAAAVFQRESKTVTAVNKFIHETSGDWGDLVVSTVIPYRLTPWNLVGQYLSYNPLIGGLKSIHEAAKGNRAEAARYAAKAVTGAVLTYAMWYLYKKGILSPSLDDRDELQKGRLASYGVMPPNHINMTGLNRLMSGGNPQFQPGDETVDTSRLGLLGAVAYTTANLGRDHERSPKSASENFFSWAANSVLETGKYAMNQSFLKNTALTLEAVQTGKGSELIRGIENTILSVPIPNTIPAVSRAVSDSKVVTKDPDKMKELNNMLQEKLRVFGSGKDLPVRRGIWGEPIPEAPAGSNPYAYQFFDISRSQTVPADPASVEVYRLWRKTGNSSVILTPTGKTITYNRKTYELSPRQQSDLHGLVGPIAKGIVDQMVSNPNFKNAPDEVKVRLLNRAYDTGIRLGKLKFLKTELPNLVEKLKKPGFQEE